MASLASRYKPIDGAGQKLLVGDVVRVLGVPDLSGMAEECRLESEPVFRHIVGQYKKIKEFDDFGCAGLTFSIRGGRHRGMHSVWIEPFLLRRRQARNAT